MVSLSASAIHDLEQEFAESLRAAFRGSLVYRPRGRVTDPDDRQHGVRHETLGWLLWGPSTPRDRTVDQWLVQPTREARKGTDSWLRATMGQLRTAPAAQGHWRHAALTTFARSRASGDLRVLFSTDAIWLTDHAIDRHGPSTQTSRLLSWWIAGVTVLADWIRFEAGLFTYRSDQCPGRLLAENAERAVSALDTRRCIAGTMPKNVFHRVVPGNAAPSPPGISGNRHAGIHFQGHNLPPLEDVTGAGKTGHTAALAHRMMTAGCADGTSSIAYLRPRQGQCNVRPHAHVYRMLFGGTPALVLGSARSAVTCRGLRRVRRPAGMVRPYGAARRYRPAMAWVMDPGVGEWHDPSVCLSRQRLPACPNHPREREREGSACSCTLMPLRATRCPCSCPCISRKRHSPPSRPPDSPCTPTKVNLECTVGDGTLCPAEGQPAEWPSQRQCCELLLRTPARVKVPPAAEESYTLIPLRRLPGEWGPFIQPTCHPPPRQASQTSSVSSLVKELARLRCLRLLQYRRRRCC